MSAPDPESLMLPADDDVLPDPRLRVMRIIIGALVAGAVAFLIIVVYSRAHEVGNPPPEIPILTYVGLGLAAWMLIAQVFVPQLIDRAARRRLGREAAPADAEPAATSSWYTVYQTRLLIAGALLEGGAHFLLIAYLLEGVVWSLLGAAVLIAVLASKFPSQSSVERWAEEQRAQVDQERLGM